MNKSTAVKWSRRQVIKGLSASAAAGLFGVGPGRAVADPPPETTSIRLLADPTFPAVCYAPQLVAEQFLRMEGFTEIFRGKRDKSRKDNERLIEELYRQIGQLKVENEWLKKKSAKLER